MSKMLINRSAVKQFVLEMWGEHRPFHEITHVSSEVYARYEAAVRAKIIADVQGHPSKGKTFRP